MGERDNCSEGFALRRWTRLGLLLFLSTLVGCAVERSRPNYLPTRSENSGSPTIVLGFVGFIDRADDPRLSVVQLGDRLREAYSSAVYVQVFANRSKEAARKTIWQLIDTNQDGTLSGEEKKDAKVILYGHSWGGSTVVSLSRELEKDQIPVMLTVQVDSIHKLARNDAMIPGNVLEAANFYQPHGFFHGRRQIFAADPARTRILGNYRFEYEKHSVRCPSSFSWYEMYFARSHIYMDCDPRVWAAVESLIRQHLPPEDEIADDPGKSLTR
jgi:hypothetical protein